jgi:CheY-like chemotaxis protein
MDNDEIRQFIVQALGEIGYPQAAPYLLRVRERAGVSPELRVMADEALVSMGYSGLSQASEAFQDLALQYYKDEGSVQADARTDRANIWSWNGQRVERIEVPRAIYNEIMSMRCCEATLRLNPADEDVIAIWVAANIQREAELGMDVESVEQDPAALADATKPENFPRSAYFARAAGARYCHKVLDLALEQDEPAVALGAIAALRRVAGESSLVGSEEYKLALAEALTYPDAAVRINAALALAGTSPTSSFAGAQHVVSALAEGLSQTGGFHVVVVDPDPANLNRVLDVVRAEGARAVGDASLYAALERARLELPTVDAFFLATDVSDPELGTALAAVRANNLYKMTPLVLLTKEGQSQRVKLYDEGDDALTVRPADAAPPDLVAAWSETTSHVGQTRLSGDDALSLALECADALHSLGVGRSTVLDIRRAEGALINAFRTGPLPLQVRSADVLALIPSASAQQAIAGTALDPAAGEELRVAAFGALAGSARTSGNLLTEASADALINLAINEPNLTLRSAASEALGALDLPGGKASRVILTATGGEKP